VHNRGVKALLTSAGIKNATIRDALVSLLGKPIDACHALFIPTAIYPFRGAPQMAWLAAAGKASSPLCELGWKSLGLLELSVLPHIAEDAWLPTVREADALLVYGGDPVFLADQMRLSGLAALLPSLPGVYVGVSAGAIAAAATFVETYTEPPARVASERVELEGGIVRHLVAARGSGLVDFAVIPHYVHPDHPDASAANAATWAARIPCTTYALDDASAIAVDTDGVARVVSEGTWQRFDR